VKNKFIIICLITLLPCIAVYAGSWVGGEWRDQKTSSAQGTNITARIITRDVNYSKIVYITEGFDPADGTSNEYTLDSLENAVIQITNGRKTIKADLLDNHYTVVLVDFDNNWSSLKMQGYAFGNLMQQMWDLSPKAEPMKVLGLSMGGVIGSFACGLKQFYTLNSGYTKETWEAPIYSSWNFKVNLCLTVDSPHSGAFIPGSVFDFVNFFRAAPDGSKAQQYYNALVSNSACQMLIRKYGSVNVSAWLTLYKNVLAVYKQTNTTSFVGVCNGSWAGNKQFTSNNGLLIIDWHYDPTGCGESWTKLWSEPEDYVKRQVFWGKWGACYVIGAESKHWLTFTNDKQFLENCPGGYTNTYQDVANALPGTKPTPAHPSHCFIPTFSSAALDYNTYAPQGMRNLKALELQLGKKMDEYSPMHKLYHQDNVNQFHVRGMALDPDLVDSILKEIKEKTIVFQQLYISCNYLR